MSSKTLLKTIALVATGCFAQTPAARYDQIVESFTANRQFMGSVLVARGTDVIFSKSYGSANIEWDIPNTAGTKFRLGSLTKQFTAASILLLEERGKLKTEDLVKKYLPDAPAAWDKITIFNLLTHTSGIPNFTSFPDYASKQMFATPVAKIVESFRDKPLDFQPGEKFSYSNSGFLLLGYLIEKISGTTYEKFVQDNLFTPLNMKDSGYDSNTRIIPRRASGYAPSPNGPVNAGYVDMTIPHGAGALYSTTPDLLLWTSGVFGGKLLSGASVGKMTTAFKDNYAFGIGSRTVPKLGKVYDHNGGIQGFNTYLAFYPEQKITVAVLSNINSQAPDEMGALLAQAAHGQEVVLKSERKPVDVPAATLSRYVGTYQLQPGVNMMITLADGQLLTQLSGQGKVPIFPESEGKFFARVVNAQIDFTAGADGKVTELILHQGGRDVHMPRTSDTVAERKEIAVAPAVLARYVGTYELRPGFDMAITIEDGKLISQATGQGKLPLFGESETKFFPKVIDATIEFVIEQDKVTALILHQGPNNIRAARK